MKGICSLLVVPMLWALTSSVCADSSPLKKSADKLMEAYGQGQLADKWKALDRLKEAGLSWQPSLTTPTQHIFACKNDEGLRVLLGMYYFDQMYAGVFGKKKECADLQIFLDNEIHKRLPLSAEWGDAGPMDPAELRSFAENPADPARRDAMLASLNKRLEAKIKVAEARPEVMDHMVDVLFGALIQGLYVSLSLAQDETIGPELVAVFNQQAKDIIQFDLVLDSFEDPELAKMVEFHERDPLIDPIKDFILMKKGQLTNQDVKDLLARVKPVRDSFITPCP